MKRLLVFIVAAFMAHCLSYAQNASEVPDTSSVESTSVIVSNASDPIPVVVERDDSSDFVKDDFNLYGIIALIVAVFSLVIAIITWIAQYKTEKHTKNVPIKDQREKFKDLSRHEYRNLCCALASAIKFFDQTNGTEKNRMGYPSESNLQKLKVEPEDIVLSIDSDVAAMIVEMQLLLRNYNIEIDVASQHLAKKNISDTAIHQDYDNILFKPLYLVKRAYDLELAIVNRRTRKSKRTDKNALLERTMLTIINEHLSKIKSSLPRFAKDGNPRFILKIEDVVGYQYPFADYTNAIERSLHFLLRLDDKRDLRTTLKLTNAIKQSITEVKDVIKNVQEKAPEIYSHITNYENMLDSMLNSTEVDFRSIFPTMLAIDAIVETVNIGMVNFD